MTANPPSKNNERDLSALVTAVFTNWSAAGVEFLVLRNYENLPKDTNHDIDVLILPSQLALAEQTLLRTAEVAGYRLHGRVEFSPVSLFFHHSGTLHQIQFDLFYQLIWRGFTLLPIKRLMERKVNRGLFAIPHPAHEAVSNLITRLVYRGYVREKYKPSISAGFMQDAAEAELLLTAAFGDRLARFLTESVKEERWDAIEKLRGTLCRSLFWRRISHEPLQSIRSWFSDLGRFMGRLLRLPGLTIVLIGPDGCGKSSAAIKLAEALKASFPPDKLLRIHWKPAVFLRKRRALRPATADPHGVPPRGRAASVAALIYHWTEFVAGWLLQIHPVLFRNGFVLVERYHYDFAVDPRRYRLDPPLGLVKMLFRLLPRPDLVFLLDAPAEILRSRKQEVSAQETVRQREAFRTLAASLPDARIIDATKPLESVVNEMTHHALEHLCSRQKRRSPDKYN